LPPFASGRALRLPTSGGFSLGLRSAFLGKRLKTLRELPQALVDAVGYGAFWKLANWDFAAENFA